MPARRSCRPTTPRCDVLAHGLEDLELLPVSAEEALDPDSKVYSRWTLHGVSHMLGMDVHDCNGTSSDIYPKGNLEVGMVLTVEPGLYFQEDDKLVPEELRGIGIRIEDDILVTADGPVNLSDRCPAPRPASRSGCKRTVDLEERTVDVGERGLSKPRG